MYKNKEHTGSRSKRLLAALAVLAVAFVVLASVPAIADESDATTGDVSGPATPSFIAVDVGKETDLTSPANGSTWTVTQNETTKLYTIALTDNTEWDLTADVSATSIAKIDVSGHALKITSKGYTDSDSTVYTLSVSSADATKLNLIYASSTSAQSAIYVENAKVSLATTNSGSNEASLIQTNVSGNLGLYLKAENATITIASANKTTSIIQTQNTIFDLSGSDLTISSATSSQNVYYKLSNSDVTATGMSSPSLAGYFELSGTSKVTATNITMYAAALTGTASIKASGWMQFDTRESLGIENYWENYAEGMAIGTVSVAEGTSVTAKAFYDAYTDTSGEKTVGLGKVTFSGVGSVSGNLAFTNAAETIQNTVGYTFEGVTYNGTASYTGTGEDASTGTAVFTNIVFSNGATISAGPIHITDGTYSSNGNGRIVITGDAEISGMIDEGTKVSIKNGANVTVSNDLTIDGTLDIATGAELTNNGGITIGATGSFTVEGTLTNGDSATITGTITVSDGATVTNNSTSSSITKVYSDSSIKTVLIAGGDIDGSEYKEQQRVEVTGNTTVTGDLIIRGILHINSGVTLTVEAGGSVQIYGGNTSVIDGSLVLRDDDTDPADLIIGESAALQVNGNLDVAGNLVVYSEGSIEFENGSSSEIGGIVSATKLTVDSTATLTIAGAVKNQATDVADGTITYSDSDETTFVVYGTLIFNSKESVSSGFDIDIEDAGAVVEIQNIILGVTGQSSNVSSKTAVITITDKGTVIYDSKGKEESSAVNQPDAANTITISGSVDSATVTGTINGTYDVGAKITGLKVESSMEETKIVENSSGEYPYHSYYEETSSRYDSDYDGLYEHAYSMTLSGTATQSAVVVYSGSSATISAVTSADIGINGKTSGIIGALSLGTCYDLTAEGNIAVDGAVGLAAKTTTADAATATFKKASKTTVSAGITLGAGAAIWAAGPITVSAAVDATAASTDLGAAEFKVLSGTDLAGVVTLSGSGSIAQSSGLVYYSSTNATSGSTLTSTQISGAYYTVGTTTTVYHYVTVDAALAVLTAGTTDSVSIFGEQTIASDATLASGDTLTLETGAYLTVGEKSGDDVTFTVTDGASLRAKSAVAAADDHPSSITVNGTMHVESSSDIQSTLKADGVISAEVYSYEANEKGNPVSGGWVEWTNLTNALANSESGQTIEVMKDATLSGTIKEGVTVKSGENTITVEQKKTLTINGVLDVSEGSLVIEGADFDSSTGVVSTAAGSVVLNGRIIVAGITTSDLNVEMDNSIYYITGAYYILNDEATIATPAYAAGIISTVEDQTVEIYAFVDARDTAVSSSDYETFGSLEGKYATIDLGTISFTGKSADEPATVNLHTNLKATAITLEDASLAVDDGRSISALVSGANGSARIVGVSSGLKIVEGPWSDSVADALIMTGSIGDDSVASTKDASTSVEFTGTVYLYGITIGTDSTSVAGTAIVGSYGDGSDSSTIRNTLTVSGSLTVGDANTLNTSTLKVSGNVLVEDAGSILSVSTLEVSGTLSATAGTVTVSGDTTVSGAVDVSALNDEKTNYVASMSTKNLFIGTTSKKTVAADASVVGNVTISGYVVAAPGATIPAVLTGTDTLMTAGYKSTAYTVDNTPYITVYTTASDQRIDDYKASKDDALFAGWYYTSSSGKETAVTTYTTDSTTGTTTSTSLNVGGVETVYAKFVDGIYEIRITADAGVSYVTIDGKLMNKDSTTGEFYSKGIAAGSHVVAISPASGYDTSKTALYNSDGTAVGSFNVSISGDYDQTASLTTGTTTVSSYIEVDYQLIGSTVASSGNVTPTPSEPTVIEKETDNGLTNILLIVLIILAVVLAALVALRLMRS